MGSNVNDHFTNVNKQQFTFFRASSRTMKPLIKPDIDGEYVQFAKNFRAALAWNEWLGLDEKTGKKKGSLRKAGDKLKMSGAYVGMLLRGRQFPSGPMGADLAEKMKVSHNWLTNNEGPMVADKLISIDHLDLEDQVDLLNRLRLAEKKVQDRKNKL